MKHSQKAAFTAILADVGIAAIKLMAFLLTGSSAILAECVHSLVDAGNSSLLVVGLRRSRMPADESHPFGYGKELYFWTLIVALLIFLVGGGVSITEGIERLRHPVSLHHLLWSYLSLGLAAIFESYSLFVGCTEFRAQEGKAVSLRAIHASKNPATFTVIIEDTAAVVGLAVAFAGTFLAQQLHWEWADGVASLTIGVLLAGVALLLVAESKALLVGEGADKKTLRRIRSIVLAEQGVRGAGCPLTMYFGPANVLLTINVRFDALLNRDGIEACIDRIERAIRSEYQNITRIFIEADSLSANPRQNE